ncbi:VOC family protein [Williamsia sp. CHRR-6]|uniref:VOC family protein n=1 Tax=Williamsia sp. CHRR-6 TaxID=2835871 RepID=UPI001BDB2A3D|nr:VOC family protein [Williamsia sp. CHRR-6]MBT0567635.1 VOC family protein [Williamsia sp. CHRR-6]
MEIRWLTAFLDFPADEFGDEVTFWRAIAGSTISPPRGDKKQFASLEPFNGDPHLRVQRVDSGPGGVHLDLHVIDLGATARHAQSVGAELVSVSDGLTLLRSPGGFVFCLVPWQGQTTRSRPIRWPGDTISIIDQVCIDVPARAYERECTFWTELTGWPISAGTTYRHLIRPDHIPLRILLQRIGYGVIGAHVDLASTHPQEEVNRHADWGAEVVAHHDHWTVMADPTGRPYCITARNPRTGELPT